MTACLYPVIGEQIRQTGYMMFIRIVLEAGKDCIFGDSEEEDGKAAIAHGIETYLIKEATGHSGIESHREGADADGWSGRVAGDDLCQPVQ